MDLSSITQHHAEGYAAALGARVRELRTAAGLTQTQLGAPMTRSFISAVEHGRALPSLRALLLISARLAVSPAELLRQVKWDWRSAYTAADDRDQETTPRQAR